jgi:hypothetical protein
MIKFVMMTMGMHVLAQIFLTWTGFLRLEILVKKKYTKGSSHESVMPSTLTQYTKIKKEIENHFLLHNINFYQMVPNYTPFWCC